MELVTLNDATAELVLLPRAPRENATLVVERENMVGSTGKVLDFLQR